MKKKTGKGGRPAYSKTTHKSLKSKGGRKQWVSKASASAEEAGMSNSNPVECVGETDDVEEDVFDFQVVANGDDDDNIETIQLPEDDIVVDDKDEEDNGVDQHSPTFDVDVMDMDRQVLFNLALNY